VDKPTWKERLQYRFDNVMDKGVIALIALLALASLIFIIAMATIVTVFQLNPDERKLNFGEAFWASLLRTLDPGTMGQDTGAGFRPAMLIVTIGGLILVASLISIVSNAFNSRIDRLQEGHSRVLESGHTLILGWSSKVVPIINELCIANEEKKRPLIVVLADADKSLMESELGRKVKHLGKRRIIVRQGDPTNLIDLALGSPDRASSIVIVSPGGVEDPDTTAITTAMAVLNRADRRTEPFQIVGELQNPASEEAANLVGGKEVHWVLAHDVVSRIMVQTCRQRGLSTVCCELLDFAADEIYFVDNEDLVGKTFAQAQDALASAAAFGIIREQQVELNPSPDRTLDSADRILVIGETASKSRITDATTPFDEQAIVTSASRSLRPEKTLVIGHNKSLSFLVRELDQYVSKGSSLTLLADVDPPTFPATKNVKTSFVRGDGTSRHMLESLNVHQFDHIVVLSYRDHISPQRADAKTLVTLLHLRDIAKKAGDGLNIVSEMLNDRNREIAEVTDADDFIVSDKLVSLMIAQVAENFHLTEVFDALFSSEGSEICVVPAGNFVRLESSVNFQTVIESARRQGQTAIGVKIAALSHDPSAMHGVYLNPKKAALFSFTPEDSVIVLSPNA
jgi:voltage-gated potassium channel Kch